MTKLGWFSLPEGLGEGYEIKYKEGNYAPRIVRNGVDIAFVDFEEQLIQVSLLIKWDYLPFEDEWLPFEVDLDDFAMPVVEREFRARWETAGFKVADESMSSCYYPEHSPKVAYPMAEVIAIFRPSSLQDGIAAIHFIEQERKEAWIHKEGEKSTCSTS